MQTRLATQQGISFTEFTYQLLQAYDFYVLHKDEACTIQVGGSDQWGNIVAGIDLINKLGGPRKGTDVFAVTTPLLTTPSGQKFGKSAGNAIALDEKVTSVFDFYQVGMVACCYNRLLCMQIAEVVLVLSSSSCELRTPTLERISRCSRCSLCLRLRLLC